MLLDVQNLFSDSQVITSSNEYSTNIVKFGCGDVSYVPIIIQVVENFDNLTSLEVKIQTSKDETFSEAVVLTSASLNLSELVEGAKFPISYLPKGNLGYMRIAYKANGTTPSKGKITAGVVAGNEISYQDL